jgi:hypothetical protein
MVLAWSFIAVTVVAGFFAFFDQTTRDGLIGPAVTDLQKLPKQPHLR